MDLIGLASDARLRPAEARRAKAQLTAHNHRCRLHGGLSTGPRTKAGLARLTASKITHGRTTKAKREEARRRAQVGREMRAELTELETWFVDRGLLDTKWRDWFKITN